LPYPGQSVKAGCLKSFGNPEIGLYPNI